MCLSNATLVWAPVVIESVTIISVRPKMKSRTVPLVLSFFLSAFCFSVLAAAQNCEIDNGNACLADCGTFTQTCYDKGFSDDSGGFTQSLGTTTCVTGIIRCRATFQIDYCISQGDCSGSKIRPQGARIEDLHRAFPGAPIFIASCSGGLRQAYLLEDQDMSRVAIPLLLRRSLIRKP